MNSMGNEPERRGVNYRFEPRSVGVEFCFGTIKSNTRGFVLDASRSAIAINLSADGQPPPDGSQGTVSIYRVSEGTTIPHTINLGTASVIRTWSNEGGKGYVLKLDIDMSETSAANLLFSGIGKDTRLANQASLTTLEIDNLEAERRSLSDCQMKLFMTTLTMAGALSSVYFGLAYHSGMGEKYNDPAISFWRAMVASLPGFLAMVSALMIAQKSNSIGRIQAFLAVLKEAHITKRFPREYSGWEAAYSMFRRCFNSNEHKDCNFGCGGLSKEEEKRLKNRRLFSNPKLNMFYVLIYLTFIFVGFLSLITVLYELLRFQFVNVTYMVISGVVTLSISGLVLYLIYFLHKLRKGEYSYDKYRRIWLDLLTRCPYQL